jgi:hypothetical protein
MVLLADDVSRCEGSVEKDLQIFIFANLKLHAEMMSYSWLKRF